MIGKYLSRTKDLTASLLIAAFVASTAANNTLWLRCGGESSEIHSCPTRINQTLVAEHGRLLVKEFKEHLTWVEASMVWVIARKDCH